MRSQLAVRVVGAGVYIKHEGPRADFRKTLNEASADWKARVEKIIAKENGKKKK